MAVSIDSINKLMAQTPRLLEPVYRMQRVNSVVQLYRGPVVVTQSEQKLKCTASLYVDWLPHQALSFRIHRTGHAKHLKWGDMSIHLEVPLLRLEGDAFFTRFGTKELRGVFRKGLLDITRSTSTDPSTAYLIFHYPNLENVWGSAVRYANTMMAARQVFLFQDWRLTLDPIPELGDRIKDLKKLGGYALTHTARLERIDGKSFRRKQVTTVLQRLHLFFSFARGRWTGPMFVVGRNSHDATVWEQWCTWKAQPWGDTDSWVPRHDHYQSVLSGFMNLANSQSDWNVVTRAVHWYVEANNQGGGILGALIHLQAALELLAWHVLTRKDGLLDEQAFQKMRAYSKIRAALRHLGIPITLPASLEAQKADFVDVVDLITKIRNEAVHPPRQSNLTFPSVDLIVPAWKHALQLVELMLLRMADYDGMYHSRTGSNSAVAAELVPWVQESAG